MIMAIFSFLIGKSPIADPVYDGYINKSIPNPNGGSNIPINPGVLVLANKEYTDGYKHIRIEIDDNNFNPGDVQGIGFILLWKLAGMEDIILVSKSINRNILK